MRQNLITHPVFDKPPRPLLVLLFIGDPSTWQAIDLSEHAQLDLIESGNGLGNKSSGDGHIDGGWRWIDLDDNETKV